MNNPQRQPERPRMQYPLYLLMMATFVIAVALAPASYFLRAAPDDRRSRMIALTMMMAGPMILVVGLNLLFVLSRYWRRK
jgi:hypothetical protein